MKANEAPKKIYITPNFDRRWFTTEIDTESIEYIRADSVIEWIKNKADKYLVDTPLCCYYDYKRAVEEFKEYIKEE